MLGKMLGEVGAAMGIGLVLLGDKLGLYKTLAAAGPLTSADTAGSSKWRPTICNPTGKPSAVQPAGTLAAGCPVRFSGKVRELRATMSLVRLLASQSRRNDARAMLEKIYGRFTEGLDTADLKDRSLSMDAPRRAYRPPYVQGRGERTDDFTDSLAERRGHELSVPLAILRPGIEVGSGGLFAAIMPEGPGREQVRFQFGR